MSLNSARVLADRRLMLVGGCAGLLLLLGLAYAFSLQVLTKDEFCRVADAQHFDSIVPLASRGRIFDHAGRLLAFTGSSFKVWVYPTRLGDGPGKTSRERAAGILARFSRRDSARVLGDMLSCSRAYVFDSHLDYDAGMRLSELVRRNGIDAIRVELQKTRVYPYGDTTGSVLGFAIRDSGKSGIEARLDAVLRGIPGKVVVQKDALGNSYRFPTYPERQPVNGADVHLTIDVDIQRIAYEELAWCVDSFRAEGGSVVVLECSTGRVRAICDYPYYDPRQMLKDKTPSYRCRAAEVSFEPGSVFKPIFALAALEAPEGPSFLKRWYDARSGVIEISGEKIHDVHPCGVQDFAGVLIHSSNVGMALLAREVDPRRLFLVSRRMGFGRPVGIELPHEDPGYFDSEYRTAPGRLGYLRLANNAFGQGLRVTLLQLAVAYATIANDGIALRPYLLEAVGARDTPAFRAQPLVQRRAISSWSAQVMKNILERVVREGTGANAASPHFVVSGKTGTAEQAIPRRGYVKDGPFVASFVGYAPKTEPRYVVAIALDNPRRGKYASSIVCPTFRRIMERIFALEPQTAQIPLGRVKPDDDLRRDSIHGQQSGYSME